MKLRRYIILKQAVDQRDHLVEPKDESRTRPVIVQVSFETGHDQDPTVKILKIAA